MNYGFVRVAAAVPAVRVADCHHNARAILTQMQEAEAQEVEIVVFPELSITAYTCADLFGQQVLLDEGRAALQMLVEASRAMRVIAIVGMPLEVDSVLLNCAVVLQQGRILGIVPKTYLPNYSEYSEQRWFASGLRHTGSLSLCGQTDIPLGTDLVFGTPHCRFGIEICEDLWAPIPPSGRLALEGADIVFNPLADSEGTGKYRHLCALASQQSARCLSAYVIASCGFGESTTDVVFGGNGLIYENGTQLAATERFSLDPQLIVSEIDVECLRAQRRGNTTFGAAKANCRTAPYRHIATGIAPDAPTRLTRSVDPHPFLAKGNRLAEECEEIFAIQVAGLAQRLVHTHCRTAIVGISGGLDSTLALLVAVRTFDKLKLSRQGILGITMPGFGTTDRTYGNAIRLMQSLGISIREISIKEACMQHFADIGHDANVHDVTYENSQARERTQLLMDIANQTNGMVVGTGDLSELALGWATYNGDHMSMYGVNAGIPKTLVQHLVAWVAQTHMDGDARATLLDIVDTPISPELIPADEQGHIRQKTEDLVGPYELHDFFLYQFARFGFRPAKICFLAQQAFGDAYDRDTIKKWLTTFFRRFFVQQFKRSCMPDGPKVGPVSLSPRGNWHMPSDASSALWLEECQNL